MSFFDEIFGKLFGKKAGGHAVLVHEPLRRTKRQHMNYQSWKSSQAREGIIGELKQAYHLKKVGIPAGIEMHVLNSRYANGFAIMYPGKISSDTFRNVFDYFKERTLDLGYRLVQGDRRILDKGHFEETIEKWYLKPDVDITGNERTNQLYGNVLIEYIALDRKPNYIKLMVNVYQGRAYTRAQSFDEYLEQLFYT